MQFKGDNEKLRGSVLLLGGGIGWTGSLALDLLINSCANVHIGTILSPHHLQMAGCSAYSTEERSNLTTTIEVYHLSDYNVNIIQQRGPVLKNHNSSFASELAQWAKEMNVKEVVFLLSVDATRRIDQQLIGSQNRVCFSKNHPREENSPWKPLEQETFSMHLRSSAFPFKFLCECNENGVPLMLVNRFCSEGNNLPDSAELASCFANVFLFSEDPETQKTFTLRAPPSWKYIQGSPLLQDVFIY
mmetsp:Transcript_7881/g.9772  ORF Transcript_7881/g.9772 Transcript_7881/m.9772 type:complete len:245 (-) Transcript_7881:37-771(-)